jgi:hypothetical protein
MKILKMLHSDQGGQTFFEILLALAIVSLPIAVVMGGLGDALADVAKDLKNKVGQVGN